MVLPADVGPSLSSWCRALGSGSSLDHDLQEVERLLRAELECGGQARVVLTLSRPAPTAEQPLSPGDRIEALWGASWYAGTVHRLEGPDSSRVLVLWDDGTWNTVPRTEVRRA